MFDPDLAIRVMNKIGKELVAAMASGDPYEVKNNVQKALNDHSLLYEILHLGPEWSDIPHTLQVIDINR